MLEGLSGVCVIDSLLCHPKDMYNCTNSIVGFTLQAKLVSSKHLIQVHLKISSRTLENLASHLVTKYTLEAQAVNHRSR